ncbi:tetratricopeptide repeat protein [Pseudomonas sp. Fl5BN2]|uniref:tetratricopeptide repeat protein n=1 Tax=unclassified Pseudomonas TaxID=196821 RepID=UPI0013790612|nr:MULTISPECIES: tetratricopeptide repeat protein [unclassified Pseudomonas]NBF01550.1 tetratricopeptide repeat protein [Pseudomonas sp. Fl5BN2]NBF07062.1 tetratricopeptide repeat protein [Pseudomonas sp. Fl4BN1]
MDKHEGKAVRDAVVKLLSLGKMDEGVELFKKKSKEISEVVRLECSGDISFYRRDFVEAAKFYEAAISLSPDHVIPRYYYIAGVQNERAGNFVDAFKYYQAAIDFDPGFVDAYVELGALLVKVGDYEGALQCYEDALRLEEKELVNYVNLRAVLIKLSEANPGRYEEKLRAANLGYEKIMREGGSRSLPDGRSW